MSRVSGPHPRHSLANRASGALCALLLAPAALFGDGGATVASFRERTDLLPATIPLFAIVFLAVVSLAAAIFIHRQRSRAPAAPAAAENAVATPRPTTYCLVPAACYLLAVATAWCILQLLARFVVFASTIPLWAMAIVMGVGFELVGLFYRRETRLLSRRMGRLLVGLRAFAFLLVALIILQPVLARTFTRRIERTVAVVVDTSDSMRFTDEEWTPGERLSLGRATGLAEEDELLLPSLEALDDLAARLHPWTVSELPAAELPSSLRRLVGRAGKAADRLARELSRPPLSDSTNPVFRAFARQLTNDVVTAIETVRKITAKKPQPGALPRLGEVFGAMREQVPAVRVAADELAWQSLPEKRRAQIDAVATTNRLALAETLLFAKGLPEKPLADALADHYGVRLFSLGRTLRPYLAPTNQPVFRAPEAGAVSTNAASMEGRAEAPGTPVPAEASPAQPVADPTASDFATALESLLTDIPSEELAGILFVTDGIHNGDASVEPVARRVGGRGVRASTVLVGSSAAPFDIAIADISAPESVFLGDKVRVRATLSASRAAGRQAHVSLLRDGEVVDETTIPISDDDFRRDISLAHAPSTNGLARYELRIDELEGERFPSNNMWKVDVAVSDDRTHVLLVDDYPRWEFRYLRNLFYARDKSVHLQYVLMHPDTIADVAPTNALPPASASRPFGEAEAGSLPESAEEWRKFDVVILGDVGPEVLTETMQSNLVECVAERGALLVSIAGPRAMPSLYPTNSPLASLLPYTYTPRLPAMGAGAATGPFANARSPWDAPETAFDLSLTPSGRVHPVMQQSSSASENEQVWRSLPHFTWRYPFDSVRAGAEIIACAKSADASADAVAEPTTAANAAEMMDAERAARERSAVIVAQNVGRGKVLGLGFDETWRLRYRVGDVRHHRFWGQVIRWGLGERLRSGTQQLRVGTDRMTYSPGDSVRLLARVFQPDFTPVSDATLFAVVTNSTPLVRAGLCPAATSQPFSLRVRLSPVEGSQGLYEAILPPFAETGAYQVSIEHPEAYSGADAAHDVSTVFFVASARRPIEMAIVAADRVAPGQLARWTGGRVVPPHLASTLANDFGEPSRTVREPLEIPLWDNRWLFLLLFGALAAEWISRKRLGLV